MAPSSAFARALALATLVALARASCSSPFDCSLNGLCTAGVCACDTPWGGDACEKLVYSAANPSSGKNLWTGAGTSDSLNTWNGPIVTGPDGTYHLFDPVYEHASLWNVLYYAHGTSKTVEGPYDWTSSPNISSTAINPAALVFPNASSGEMVYSLWIGSEIFVAADPAGPFLPFARNPLPGNTATAYHKGTLYCMNQANKIMMATSLEGPWTAFSTIVHPGLPYTVEDPFIWFDNRGNFHAINHAYNTGQRTNCTSSWVSSHSFSTDGSVWGHTDQPYDHVVHFDDGTSHAFCTLERPSLVFNAAGVLTHLHVAADLVTEDGGCPNRGKGCVDCKYEDHAGTLLIQLGV